MKGKDSSPEPRYAEVEGSNRRELRASGFQGRRYTKEIEGAPEGKRVLRGMPRRRFLGPGGRPSPLLSYGQSKRRRDKEARRVLGAMNNQAWQERKNVGA